jgi:hypothetical protein
VPFDELLGLPSQHSAPEHSTPVHNTPAVSGAEPSAAGGSPRRPRLLRSLGIGFLVSAVVYMLAAVLGLRPPYPLVYLVSLAGFLIYRAVRTAGEPAAHRTADAMVAPLHESDAVAATGGDGMVAAVRRWERRLEWGWNSPDQAATLRLRLAEVADELLRQRRGVNRATDPDRARRLLGDRPWSLLYDPAEVPATPGEIEKLIDQLERL